MYISFMHQFHHVFYLFGLTLRTLDIVLQFYLRQGLDIRNWLPTVIPYHGTNITVYVNDQWLLVLPGSEASEWDSHYGFLGHTSSNCQFLFSWSGDDEKSGVAFA